MEYFAIAILLMSAVTYLPRVLPVLLLSRRSLPEPLVRWLSYIPVAVLAALLGPTLLAPQGELLLAPFQNPGLWISIPVFAVALLSRNFFATVFSGMLLIALWRFFF